MNGALWGGFGTMIGAALTFLSGGRSEVLKHMQEQIDGLRIDVSDLRGELRASAAEIRYRDNYIGLLVQHINDQLPPPPPAWPPMLERQ